MKDRAGAQENNSLAESGVTKMRVEERNLRRRSGFCIKALERKIPIRIAVCRFEGGGGPPDLRVQLGSYANEGGGRKVERNYALRKPGTIGSFLAPLRATSGYGLDLG